MTGREIDVARYSRPVAATARDAASCGSRAWPRGRLPRHQLQRSPPARCSGFAGLMGAGRTAVLKGHLRPAAGRSRDDRESTASRSTIRNVSDAVAAGIGYVPEDRLSEGLFLDFAIGDNIVVRALDRLVSKDGWITGSRKATGSVALGRAALDQDAVASVCRRAAFPAAISSASCWRSGWRASRGSCSSTARRLESTSARSPPFTRSSWSLPRARRGHHRRFRRAFRDHAHLRPRDRDARRHDRRGAERRGHAAKPRSCRSSARAPRESSGRSSSGTRWSCFSP